jgi:5-methylcytosine-specific restriction protein B
MSQQQQQLWDDFLAEWPPERVTKMTLEEYCKVGSTDTLISWLEIRTEKLGSIWGGSAFKFGIYHRNDTVPKEPTGGRIWGENYAWYVKYGDTPETAFAAVRDRLVSIVEAAQAGNLDAIDEIDFSEAVKWKIAFLYQSPEAPSILPIYKRDGLVYCYKQINPDAGRKTPMSLMHSGLMDLRKTGEDVFALGERLWKSWQQVETAGPQHWVVPLHWLFTDAAGIETFLAKDKISGEDIPEKFDKLLTASEVRIKDRLALTIDKKVRALAEVTNAEPGDYAWTQQARDFDAPLASVPTDRAKKLTDAEIAQIWQMPAGVPVKPPDTLTKPPVKAEPAAPPKNIILYGPPGTGKTYHTVQRALELILGPETVAKMSRDTQAKQFRELQRLGRIEFVTFHQNYGYEEFVEGLRPVLSEATDQGVLYEIHDGVFKRIALRAAAAGLPAPDATATSFETLWRKFIEKLREDGQRIVKSSSGIDLILELSAKDNVKAYRCDLNKAGEVVEQSGTGMLASKSGSKLIWENREKLGPEPDKVTSVKTTALFSQSRGGGGGHHFTVLWPVYKALWDLNREIGSTSESAADAEARAQEIIDKPTPGTAEFNFTSLTTQHVLVIDEINRGNISKILGELITLLEPEKRLGQPEELKLPLAYTPEHRFAVPPNLHIIGTMNTADRSIALMDVALRRRFTFEELMPDAEVIRTVVGKASGNLVLADFLTTLFQVMNSRIRFLYDRDHQIGHAYFLRVRNLEDLRLLLVDKLVPLLQEYFYGSWDKICLVLGCPHDEIGKAARSGPVVIGGQYVAPVIEAKPLAGGVISGWESEDYEARLDYGVAPALMKAGTSNADLLPYFLGIGNFSAEERGKFASALTPFQVEADPVAESAEGEGAAG